MTTVNSTVAWIFILSIIWRWVYLILQMHYIEEKRNSHTIYSAKIIGIFNQLQWSLLYSFLVFLCLYHLVNTCVIELSDLYCCYSCNWAPLYHTSSITLNLLIYYDLDSMLFQQLSVITEPVLGDSKPLQLAGTMYGSFDRFTHVITTIG